jgi:hypothetical protein
MMLKVRCNLAYSGKNLTRGLMSLFGFKFEMGIGEKLTEI